MKVRLPFALLALVVAFGGGLGSARLSSHLFEREAHAQTGLPTAVFVPAEGLAFRAADGRIIARLSYDGRGGNFEVYDNRERPAGALRPAVAGDTPRPLPGPLPSAPSTAVAAAAGTAVLLPTDIDLGY